MTQQDQPTIPVSTVGSSQPAQTARVESSGMPPSITTESFQSSSGPYSSGQETMVLGKPPPSLAWLAVLTGIRAGRLFPLDPRGTVVGRDAQCDVILDDTAVSRQHSKLRREPGPRKNCEQYYIYDLGSANGTFVNDQKVVHKALTDGDRIRIGDTVLVFKTAETTPAPKRPAKKKVKRATSKTKVAKSPAQT